MTNKTVALDEQVAAELPMVQKAIAARSAAGPRTFYSVVLQELSSGTRNTPSQLQYLHAYEQALAVFRAASYQLRIEMDVMTLEQRLAARHDPSRASEDLLARHIADSIMFSNRYALFLAGQVGLSLLNGSPADVQSAFNFGSMDTSKKKDEQTSVLVRVNTEDLVRVFDAQRQSQPLTDDDLKHTLEMIFTSWIKQFNWDTFKDVAAERGVNDLRLAYSNLSVEAGIFKSRNTSVIVDDRFMQIQRADIIGSEDYVEQLWNPLLKLLAYDTEKRKKVFDTPKSIFTFGAPGGGKTFIAHALIRELERVARAHGVPFWALTHSTTDYASHYQNLTANRLAELASQIRDFPGPVVMYVADADNILMSRQDDRLTAEQRQTLSVYLKMFDGSLIPKGKFTAIMDANFIEGIDEATKSRIFDLSLVLPRFSKPEDFAKLARVQLTDGIEDILAGDEWLTIGRYLLGSPLSNREIGHVTGQLRSAYAIPEALVAARYEEKVAYRNQQMRSLLTMENILKRFQSYIENQLNMERESMKAQATDRYTRFMGALTKTAETTVTGSE